MMRKSTLLMSVISLILIMSITSTSANEIQSVVYGDNNSSEVRTVYINELEAIGGHFYIHSDQIEWYEGEEADAKFLALEEGAEEIGGAIDGYYIVNDSEELQKLEVAGDAGVIMQIYDRNGTYEGADIQWNEEITLEEFAAAYENNQLIDLAVFPYHITIEDGKVTSIVQQYIP